MSVKLRTRKNTDGTTTQYLDIYYKGERKREFLHHLKLVKPANPADREGNKVKVQQAQQIAIALAAEKQATEYNTSTDAGKKTVVTTWMQTYVDNYTKADKRTVQSVLNRFIKFLKEEGKPNLTFWQIDNLMIEDFIEYLESKATGEGASSYFKRFKKMLRHAFRKGLMKKNILDYVERKPKGKAKKKDILTLEEIKVLVDTPINSSEVKRAFLFCLVTGLRWVDVKSVLKWRHIDLINRQLNLRQSKTDVDLSSHLNETALELLGTEKGKADELVFNLPSDNGANKTIKAWVKRAGIDKKITWHNARHSFGTNLIFHGAEMLTTSKLLGHTSVKHTQRYVEASKEMKENATKLVAFKILKTPLPEDSAKEQ